MKDRIYPLKYNIIFLARYMTEHCMSEERKEEEWREEKRREGKRTRGIKEGGRKAGWCPHKNTRALYWHLDTVTNLHGKKEKQNLNDAEICQKKKNGHLAA